HSRASEGLVRKASTLAQDIVSKFNIQTRAEPSRIQVTVGARPCTCSGKKIVKAMKRTIGPTCGPLGPGEAPSFAPTVTAAFARRCLLLPQPEHKRALLRRPAPCPASF